MVLWMSEGLCPRDVWNSQGCIDHQPILGAGCQYCCVQEITGMHVIAWNIGSYLERDVSERWVCPRDMWNARSCMDRRPILEAGRRYEGVQFIFLEFTRVHGASAHSWGWMAAKGLFRSLALVAGCQRGCVRQTCPELTKTIVNHQHLRTRLKDMCPTDKCPEFTVKKEKNHRPDWLDVQIREKR